MTKYSSLSQIVLVAVCLTSSMRVAVSQTGGDEPDYPRTVLWGDTHLHTNLSVDILDTYNPMGRGLSREDAYRFARGEEITAHNGMKVRRSRPLDFLVIADHAENIGLHQGIFRQDPVLMESAVGRDLRARYEAVADDSEKLQELFRYIYANHGLYGSVAGGEKFQRSVWDTVVESADRNNEPGVFTAFIGYEFTSHDFNLHRVMIFKDDAEKAGRFLPFSQFDSKKPEDLWRYLDRYVAETGGEVIAIPHNANLSRGRMFMLQQSDGTPIDENWAVSRNRWEPLYEVTQIKGDSEAHPLLSPQDEFADFETWRSYYAMEPNEDDWRKFEYARSALKLGLQLEEQFGVNPFKYGLIGSSDTHSSLSQVSEKEFIGNGPRLEPAPDRLSSIAYDRGSVVPAWKLNAAGYAAVWASENTREAIFDALKRREAYATTGPRITLRFFGGWDFESGDLRAKDIAGVGYASGVPMGGDLRPEADAESPMFLIRAIKDPDGANLDRIQVIKGWLDRAGTLHEQVYDVALSDGRKLDANGAAPSIESTVDLKTATYTNSVGDVSLQVMWEDPDFDKRQKSFYYVRVLEIPTPRWPAYEAVRFGINIDALDEQIPLVTQERAYSSPIWYTP